MVCPSVTDNLLSVSKLADQGLDTFSKDGVTIGHSGSLVSIVTSGRRQGNSYTLNFPLSSAKMTYSAHEKYGHLNMQDLAKLSKHHMVTSLDLGTS